MAATHNSKRAGRAAAPARTGAGTMAGARPLWLALLLGLPAAPLLAQDGGDEEELSLVYGDRDSVSIATGTPQPLRRAPSVASAITAADIAAMGATDLDQVMETVAGVHVNRSANNYAPLYVVRGIASQMTPQLLVLQNGVPVTTLMVGNKGNLWGGFPVEHIARIEVMRGPGSALYGSDAFSGVVNIITKGAADTPGTEFGSHLGSFRSRDAWVQHGGSLGPVEVAAYLRSGHTDGFRGIIDADAQSRNDGLFGTRASLAPGPVNTGYDAVDGNLDLGYGNWRLRLGYKLRDKLGTGAGIASALDPLGQQKSERASAGLSWADARFSRHWGLGASVNGMYYSQEIPVPYQLLPPGLRLPTGRFPDGMRGAPETWERQLRLAAHANYSGWTGHQLRVGVGHDDLNMYRTRERLNFGYAANGTPVPLSQAIAPAATPFLLPHRRQVDYLYLQDEWRLASDWTLTAGLRHDRYSDFGGTTNPRLALVWDASYDLTAKLLYGRAFRAPAFSESYSIVNPVAFGNPALKPETNATLEAALSWQARADAQLNLTLYRYAMADIIRTVPNPLAGTGATYANTGDQSGHGVEVEGKWSAGRDLRLTANYAWQRSRDEATGKDAGYAPRHHLYARADWQFSGAYQLGGQVNRVAGRARAPGDTRAPVADYTTVDLTLATRRGKGHWNFSASVRNLFNADVREPSLAPGLAIPHDLPMAPRALWLQAMYQL